MEKIDIFKDITERTGGDIYLGVVGPVRTGKSTFIKKFVELMVLPNIEDMYDRERARDELPQSGGGKTIMTTEPKFIPADAVQVNVRNGVVMNVRVVDCVGYAVAGALGYEEEDGPRMVKTPWNDDPIPFEEAAEIGTRKVITDHSTIGIVITTDGSITDIERENYFAAEQKVVEELKSLQKPFVVVLNTSRPYDEKTMELAHELEEKFSVPVLPVDCAELTQEDMMQILEEVLYEFPVAEVNINLPLWIDELDEEHHLRQGFTTAVQNATADIIRLREIDGIMDKLAEYENIQDVLLQEMDLGTGIATIEVTEVDGLFDQVLKEIVGVEIAGKHTLLRILSDYSMAKREYDKLSKALAEVARSGYGVVTPALDEMLLEEPELIKQGGRFGVKLKASAPSLHIIRADITTEITPIIGTEKQCEELVKYMLDEFEEDPKKLWQSNIFGKSLQDLVREGVQNKLYRMPENAQMKLQDTLQRIVNEGNGGLICIII